MSSEITNNSVLHFDIFKNRFNFKDAPVPEYAQNLLLKLQSSIHKLQDDSFQKYLVSNDTVPKVLNDLEKNLNSIMKKNILVVKSVDPSKKIKLGDLYRFSLKNNAVLRKHLNSIYLTSRVYKSIYKDHMSMDNLKLRLISVRCKAIRDICMNESKRGKLRHLRCTRNPKLVPSMPKKLKSLVRKINRELLKYTNKDQVDEMANILAIDSNQGWEKLSEGLEEVVTQYYRKVEADSGRTGGLVRGLMEICGQNSPGDGVMLNSCDEEAAIEYLASNYSDEIENDFSACDGRSNDVKPNNDGENIATIMPTPPLSPPCTREDIDLLDLDNFRLVDVWEEKNEITDITPPEAPVPAVTQPYQSGEPAEIKRRKRRSRFAPLTDDDLAALIEPRTFGFCSTFVDEDAGGSEKRQIMVEQVSVVVPPATSVETAQKTPISSRMFDVVAMDEEEVPPPQSPQNDLIEPPMSRGDLCKLVLRRLHDSLQQAVTNGDSVLEPWRRSGPPCGPLRVSDEAAIIGREALAIMKDKVDTLVRDHLNRCLIRRKLGRVVATNVSIMPDRPLSPSPTPFDQTIEASLKKPRGVATGTSVSTQPPVVGKRPTTRSEGAAQSSPERARLRAMMLSYKRDVVKSREVGIDKNGENLTSQSTVVMDECSVGDLVCKTGMDQCDTSHVEQDVVAKHIPVDSDSEGLISSSDDNDDERADNKKKVTHRAEISRMQWLVPPPESVAPAPIPAPATPFLDDETQCWTGRKVFVVDSHDRGSSIAHLVKTYLQKNGARVFDTSNYKQAGKDLHVLVHQDWRFPDSSNGSRPDNGANGSAASQPISLLLLKNNSGVHFLSYTDLESVSRFSCQTIFPHSRSCIFLDRQALVATHSDNIGNMLDFMINERQTSNRIWCLKISSTVYRQFTNKMTEPNLSKAELDNLSAIQSILLDYSSKHARNDSMGLVEIQTELGPLSSGDVADDAISEQDHVLGQQYYLQKKFRHFCILTDNLNTTELDIGHLSMYGVAVLPLNTFLLNKTGKYISRSVCD